MSMLLRSTGPRATRARRAASALAAAALLAGAGSAAAFTPPRQAGSLGERAFTRPELALTSTHAPLDDLLERLPNRAAWERARRAAQSAPPQAWIDPRSGVATAIVDAVPLLPGDGDGNRVSLADVSARLGRAVARIDEIVVAELARRAVAERAELLGLDPRELGALRAARVSDELWQVSARQEVAGVSVRHALFAAVISHGNLVLMGTQRWGRVAARAVAALDAEQALERGFERAGGRSLSDRIVAPPRLEFVATAPPEQAQDAPWSGAIGQGYRHRLAWVFAFTRDGEQGTWEALVAADDGTPLALRDADHYAVRQIRGNVYPLTNTGICPLFAWCGTMKTGYPMPFADTGLAAPNNFTNSAGLYNWTSGTVTTTLSGKYMNVNDACGATSASIAVAGPLDLGGTNGQHDCATPGFGGLGNTAASRSAFYELNKLAEQGRGWLPGNAWLSSQVTSTVNILDTCNAGYSSGSGQMSFFRSGVDPFSGDTCRNTGEIAAVFDHEWGHGLDDHDSGGAFSLSSEGYADIAAIYRLNSPCVGPGFFAAFADDPGCGNASDGTPNVNEAQLGPVHCTTNCSGVRDADWMRHADQQPDTALGFVCGSCLMDPDGPCGRQVHCGAAPVRQAAWDLVARDLRSAPFNLNAESALIVGTKLFYQGSGLIGDWHACTCGNPSGGSSSGCGATNGYMQWLAADDNNGNLGDGTPHMTALFAAFDRHGIACSTPTPVNSTCSGTPTAAPTLTAIPASNSVTLAWTPVSGASAYWVFRSEGQGGCSLGKAKIAEVVGTTYTDTQVANGRTYYYNVVAKGSSSTCFGPASACVAVTPADSTPPTVAITQPAVDVEVIGPYVNVTATASDNVEVVKVEFFVNNVIHSSDLSAPFTTQINTIAPGTYSVVARAHDAAGNIGVSAPRLIEKLDPNNP